MKTMKRSTFTDLFNSSFAMLYILVLIFALFIWWYMSHLKWRKEYLFQCMEKLPGLPYVPIIGTSYIFLGVATKDMTKTFRHYSSMYGPISRSWHGNVPEVHLRKAEYLEKVLNNSVNLTKGYHYEIIHPWVGEGLLTSTGSKWRQHRKLLTPAFHFKILEHFLEVFIEKSQILINILNCKTNGKVFDIYPFITHCALDIICETAMGVSTNAMSDSDNEYIAAVAGACELSFKKMMCPWLNIDKFNLLSDSREYRRCISILHNFAQTVINERKLAFRSSNISKFLSEEDVQVGKKKRLTFLDLLLEVSENEANLTDTDIREEVDTFMFEGHDTTTSAISWCLFLLGNHHEIQEKVHEEIRHVLNDNNAPQTMADLGQLNYLECVIKESLRLYPSVPFISRKLTEEIYIDGFTLPAGVHTNLHILEVHRDPNYFPDPERFDPDRFLPENTKHRHPFAYVPFSAGPRNCIGQKFAMYEEKTVLASILKNFKITSVDNQKDIEPIAELVLRPHQGVRVILEKRL